MICQDIQHPCASASPQGDDKAWDAAHTAVGHSPGIDFLNCPTDLVMMVIFIHLLMIDGSDLALTRRPLHEGDARIACYDPSCLSDPLSLLMPP